MGLPSAPSEIRLGIVGTDQSIEGICNWLERCREQVAAKPSKQPTLHPRFPGFNRNDGFHSTVVLDSHWLRPIPAREIERMGSKPNDVLVATAVDRFLAELRYLAENTNVNVLVCAMPIELIEAIEGKREGSKDAPENEENFDGVVRGADRSDFHDMLKAKAMALKKPVQVIRPATYDESMAARQKKKSRRTLALQDPATRAWNFHTALYYKAGGTPWRIMRDSSDYSSCYVGISFYVTRDRASLMTSMAQVFNERGEGVIVRGGVAQISREDRQPHLSSEDAYTLLKNSLTRYRDEHKTLPARVVLHKSSSYNDAEMDGFHKAIEEKEIEFYDLLSITRSDAALFRYGLYSPLRGTMLSLDANQHVLYTNGSVNFFRAYPGLYLPVPRLFRCDDAATSPIILATEILALTKMNWNTTKFSGSLPITLRAARQVGYLLKYIADGERIEAQYRYYM